MTNFHRPLSLLLLLAFLAATVPAWAQDKVRTLQGKVVKVQAPDNVVILRTTDGQEVKVLVDERATLRWNDRPMKLVDLAAGTLVTIDYEMANDRLLARAVTVPGPVEALPVLTIKGKVVRVQSDPNVIIVRSADGKELALGLDQQTTIQVGGRDVRLVNLTAGMDVTVMYQLRPVASSIQVPAVTVVPAPAAAVEPALLRGKIVKVLGTENVFILSTEDGQQVRLLVDDRSVLRLKDRQVKLGDLREDMIVAVQYDVRGNQRVVTALDTQAAVIAAPAALTGQVRGQVLEGDRPQPGLEVNLVTGDGRIAATVRTLPDGTFRFENVAPGNYTVSAVKPASKTSGATRVTVQANAVGTVVVNLLRQ